MPGSSNFLVFNQSKGNIVDDTSYSASTYRQNGIPATPSVAPSNIHNKIFYQTSIMTAAIGQLLANRGYTVSDADLTTLVTVLGKLADITHGHTGSADGNKIEPSGIAQSVKDLFAPSGYGLGTTAIDKTNTDLNLVADTGFYKGSGSLANHYPNASDGFTITVIKYGADYITQDAISFGGVKFTRACVGGVWSAWKQAVTTDTTLFAPNGYGLGGIGANVWSVDLNTVILTGFYSGKGSLAQNFPLTNVYFNVTVQQHSSNYVSQLAMSIESNQVIYVRKMEGGTWSAWKQIATTDQAIYIVAQSLGVNGYRKWSDGTIEQWGEGTALSVNSTQAITFPTAFTDATKVHIDVGNAGTTAVYGLSLSPCALDKGYTVTTTTFQVFRANNGASAAGTLTPTYYAIGK